LLVLENTFLFKLFLLNLLMAKENRPDFDELFMLFAYATSKRSTCLRRKVGAVIVQDRRPVSVGYNGAPQGVTHVVKGAV
jgi:deoxycytidylate deaminase